MIDSRVDFALLCCAVDSWRTGVRLYTIQPRQWPRHCAWRQLSFSLPLALCDQYTCKADCARRKLQKMLVETRAGLHESSLMCLLMLGDKAGKPSPDAKFSRALHCAEGLQMFEKSRRRRPGAPHFRWASAAARRCHPAELRARDLGEAEALFDNKSVSTSLRCMCKNGLLRGRR